MTIKLKKINAIFFDLDDTLFPTYHFAEFARRNAIRSMIQFGLKANHDEAYQKLIEIIKETGSNYDKHFNLLSQHFNGKVDAKIVAAGVNAYHNAKNTIIPFPYTHSTLLELKKRNIKLYIATNGNPIKQWDKILRLNIDYYFDEVFISEEVGMDKSKLFFKKILNKLKLYPKNCIMIGNSIDVDIIPALQTNMYAILIDHYNKFLKLKERSKKVDTFYYATTNNEEIFEMNLCKKLNKKMKNCSLEFFIVENLQDILKLIN
ncbi:MAG: TIGR02253 family HAD-type hydrolase [Candidatus Anstonellales archaeon]